MRGRIFNFQRYCIHDGPGIRSVVFFHGCPLRCRWCCNPESFADQKFSRTVEVKQVLSWILEDLPYFRNSGGGVTLSGGEPLLQIEFAEMLLKRCKQHSLNTAVETCGHVSWKHFRALDGLVDYYLYDIKHLDPELHRQYTTADNALILDNLKRLSRRGKNIFLRVPLIPGHNLNRRQAVDIAKLAREISATEIHLLPYHRFGEKKYAQQKTPYPLGGRYTLMSYPQGRHAVGQFLKTLKASTANVYIGG